MSIQAVNANIRRLPESPYAVWLLLGLAFFVRLVMTFGAPGIVWPDSFAYYRSAALMANGITYTWHEIYRTPLYPFFLSLFLRFGQSPGVGIAIIAAQHLLGVACVYLTYSIGKRIFNPTVGFFAALLLSIHSLQLYYETVVQTEALFVFFLLFSIWQTLRVIDAPSPEKAAGLGLLLACLTLTRPIGQFVILFCLLAIFLGSARKDFLRLAAAIVAAFLIFILPWMCVNLQRYHFFGLSQDLGLNLFHRVVDVEHLEPLKQTQYPQVRRAWENVRGQRDVIYFRVYDELRRKHIPALKADRLMAKAAMETLLASPWSFPFTSLRMYAQLFFNPRDSVQICPSSIGRYLCTYNSVGQRLRAFPNDPSLTFKPARKLVHHLFYHGRLPMGLLCMLAIVGLVVAFSVSKLSNSVLLVGISLYFSGLAALLNVPEDRFRLPIDPVLMMFAVLAAERVYQFARARFRSEPIIGGEFNRKTL